MQANLGDANLGDSSLIDAVPALIWASDSSRKVTFVNRAWRDFTGQSAGQQGDDWFAYVHPADLERCQAIYLGHFDRKTPFRREYRLRRQDGTWRWMLETASPRHGGDGVFQGFVGSCLDITEQREAERQRQRDLEEKAAQLQELHHRVRNNAQVLDALVTIQAQSAAEASVREALHTAGLRAAAMNRAQEQMHAAYTSHDFDLAGYVYALVASLVAGLPGQDRQRIKITLDAPTPVTVPLPEAVPLGLIVNELLMNAMRHAFPDGREGRVGVKLWRAAEGGLSLTVSDDGVGLPGTQGQVPRPAGGTIVRTLAAQLGAAITVSHDKGTRVTVALPPQP